jgi:hypothetical protein
MTSKLDELIAEAEEYSMGEPQHLPPFSYIRRLVAVVRRQRKFVDDVDFLVECGDIKRGFTTDHVRRDCESLAAGEKGDGA